VLVLAAAEPEQLVVEQVQTEEVPILETFKQQVAAVVLVTG
jgi:hypothetical protein